MWDENGFKITVDIDEDGLLRSDEDGKNSEGEGMATRQEIINVIDDLLEGAITQEKARVWAEKEIPKTDDCEDPPSALVTMALGLDPDPKTRLSGDWREELLLARKVLIRGVPCPHKEFRKTVEAYWMAYTPGKTVVLCQIKRTEKGERVFELIEEAWEGEQTFYDQIPIPIQEKEGPFLSEKEMKEKMNEYKMGRIAREKVL